MRTMTGIGMAAASALLLTGCGASADAGEAATSGGPIAVVASTDVYGQIVSAIGGDDVTVTALIDSAAQDPHAFEPSARDQLAVSRAALIVDNGGGYDPFVDALVQATGADAPVITAVDLLAAAADGAAAAADGPVDDAADAEGLNEHVWYDLPTVARVAEAVADELSTLRPDDAATFAMNLTTFEQGVDALESALGAVQSADGGSEIFVTEPVPLYLTDAAGLRNVAPDAFTEAVEEGQDVPPATLLESLDLIASGDVRAVIVNAQTGGAETVRVTDAAASAGVPVVSFAETLPEGKTYLEWMSDNIRALQGALAG